MNGLNKLDNFVLYLWEPKLLCMGLPNDLRKHLLFLNNYNEITDEELIKMYNNGGSFYTRFEIVEKPDQIKLNESFNEKINGQIQTIGTNINTGEKSLDFQIEISGEYPTKDSFIECYRKKQGDFITQQKKQTIFIIDTLYSNDDLDDREAIYRSTLRRLNTILEKVIQQENLHYWQRLIDCLEEITNRIEYTLGFLYPNEPLLDNVKIHFKDDRLTIKVQPSEIKSFLLFLTDLTEKGCSILLSTDLDYLLSSWFQGFPRVSKKQSGISYNVVSQITIRAIFWKLWDQYLSHIDKKDIAVLLKLTFPSKFTGTEDNINKNLVEDREQYKKLHELRLTLPF